MTNEIIVGVDGTESAAHALRWAVAEAKARYLKVVAVLAWGWFDQHHAVIAPRMQPDYAEPQAEAALRTYINEALDAEDAETVEHRVVEDVPGWTLIRESADAAMLVVGGRHMSGAKAVLLGSVTDQCLHYASCPVVVVHDEWEPRHDNERRVVVVGFDGSEGGWQALDFAGAEAEARDAELHIVHAWQVPVPFGFPLAGVPFDPSPIETSAHRLLEAARARVSSRHAVLATTTAIRGEARTAIVDHAKDADLVVVGSRGMGGFAALLLGSVAHDVARRAECPVAIVREQDDAPIRHARP